jgi:hypothetical protein
MGQPGPRSFFKGASRCFDGEINVGLVSGGTPVQNLAICRIVNRKGFTGFGINSFPVNKQPPAGGHKIANLRISLFKRCCRHVSIS